MKIASALMFTVSGVPSIFYGDEYGMENNDGSSRGCFDWDNYKNEIFEWYTKLTKIRKLKCMKDAETNILYADNGKLIFERKGEDERVVVMVNLSDNPLQIHLEGDYISFISGKKINNFKLKKLEIEILIEQNKNTGAEIVALVNRFSAQFERVRDLTTPSQKPIHEMTLEEFERVMNI